MCHLERQFNNGSVFVNELDRTQNIENNMFIWTSGYYCILFSVSVSVSISVPFSISISTSISVILTKD